MKNRFSRRRFLGLTTASAGGLAASRIRAVPPGSAGLEPVRDFLRGFVLPRSSIDRFLDPSARIWAKFDAELGYTLRNSFMRDGAFGAHTLSRYQLTGQRQQVNFADAPCRINTYGDSFTQGHQVSDGETWQEVLAAHFCEPIRNFGIGGFGVYQAYLRLLRTEAGELGAPYVIFNIWGDDHLRSINAWRWLTFPPEVVQSMDTKMFHANPWRHARLDAESGALVERPNPCPTPESLYRLCGEESVFDLFQDDEIVHALVAIKTGQVADPTVLERMAAAVPDMNLDLSTPDTVRGSVNALYHAYAVQVGMKVIEKTDRFLSSRGKKLLVLLSHPMGSVWHHCEGRTHGDPDFIDWHPAPFRALLEARDIPYVDTVHQHIADFRQFKITAKEYVDRYYIGHYNPAGNHFFAFAIRPALLDWLDPKPPAYQGGEEALIRFEGYLPQ